MSKKAKRLVYGLVVPAVVMLLAVASSASAVWGN
jgi:hypothetical protein